MRKVKALLSSFLAMTSVSALLFIPLKAVETDGTVAHWKFQNETGYYEGDISKDELTFIDLTGNGNNLTAAFEGNGDKLSIFKWDTGSTVGDTKFDSSLYFGNTLENAKSVDPYTDEASTSWTGGYTSGKYLHTVSSAPINAMDFKNGYTVEIIFKLSSELNNDYNRYTGIFSRQGVLNEANECPFSMAITEFSDTEGDNSLGSGYTGLQFVQLNQDGTKTNKEFYNQLYADQWVHYMVTNDGTDSYVYVDGELIDTYSDCNGIYVTNPAYGWDVGVGRKSGVDHIDVDTMNKDHEEGLIRRLFCGSIAEIRVLNKEISIDDSLFAKKVVYDIPKQEEITVAVDTVDNTADDTADANPAAPQTYDLAVTSAVITVISAISLCLIKKIKQYN